MKLAAKSAKFIADERAAVAIEYALIVSLIALAVIPSAGGVGINLNSMYYRIASAIGF